MSYDDKVLEDTLFIKDFEILNGKYYLTDARYYNIDYLLCFYCGIYYYPKKMIVAGTKSANKE